MSTISMVTGFPGNGSASLRGSSTVYTVTNGIAQVNVQDVPLALAQGWTLHGGSAAAFAASSVHAMNAPATYIGSSVTLPDQTTAAITATVAQIPAQFVNFMTEQGWRLVGANAGT
jgi:hypothetical protein